MQARLSAAPGSLVRQFNRRLLVLGAAITALFLLAVALAVYNRFSHLEEQEVAAHFERAASLFADVGGNMKARSLDWAVWDDTYAFLMDGNETYTEANLGYTSIFNLDANAMAFVTSDGSLRRAVYADFDRGGLSDAKADRFAQAAMRPGLAEQLAGRGSIQAYVRDGDRLLAVSLAEVFRSDGSGPAAGYLAMGRELSAEEISATLGLPAQIDFATAADAPALVSDWRMLEMQRPVTGLDGKPVATIRFQAPRRLLGEGLRLLLLAGIGAMLAGVVLVATMGRMVRSLVISPLGEFQQHVAAIKETGDLTPFDEAGRGDELGQLYREFNSMTDELTVLRAKVEAQSYIIGKRENAVSVMHNIGNGIGPVKTILSKLEGQMVLPVRGDVNRALDELASGHEPTSRTARLLDFLRSAFNLSGENLTAQREMVRTALRSVDTVEGIIINAMNESKQDPIADEATDIGPVLHSAAALARQRDGAIAISLDCEQRFQVRANRVLLAQVVENLLKNAVEAITAAGGTDGQIAIAARDTRLDGLPAVELRITDNGDGFDPASTARLFERGHSSRGKAVGGLGLHWCANTVSGMGGRLDLTSPGEGQGACATIVLPLDPESYGTRAAA